MYESLLERSVKSFSFSIIVLPMAELIGQGGSFYPMHRISGLGGLLKAVGMVNFAMCIAYWQH